MTSQTSPARVEAPLPSNIVPKATKTQKGEDARDRILQASIEEFAAQGYNGASTREIAARSSANISALSYYFGGKQQLYKAAIDHIICVTNSAFIPIINRANEALANSALSPTSLREILIIYVNDLCKVFLLGATEIGWQSSWSILLARSEFEPPDGDAWAFRSTSALLLAPLVDLIYRILNRPSADEECRIIAVALIGQITAFRPLPNGEMGSMGWNNVDPERLLKIQDRLAKNCLAIFDAAEDG